MATEEVCTGRERDQESGLVYAGACYYMPALGRWMTPDPLADQNIDRSPYHYVNNNPLLFVDPNGLDDYYYDEDGNEIEHRERGWLWNLIVGDRYYGAHEQGPVDRNGRSYFRANSRETVCGVDPANCVGWSDVDLSFQADEFVDRLGDAVPADGDNRSNLDYANQESRPGGAIDQRRNLSPQSLYLFNGVLYNSNEAGNIVWGATMHYLGFNYQNTSLAGHAGTQLIEGRWDEPWDQRAIQAGWLYHQSQGHNPRFPERLKSRQRFLWR